MGGASRSRNGDSRGSGFEFSVVEVAGRRLVELEVGRGLRDRWGPTPRKVRCAGTPSRSWEAVGAGMWARGPDVTVWRVRVGAGRVA